MGTVDVYTAVYEDDLHGDDVISGSVDGSGHLILGHRDGSSTDAGNVKGATGAPGAAGAIPNRYNNATAYTVNQVVGFMGRLWICIQAGTGKPPPFYTSYWKPVTGGDVATWNQDDPFFSGDVFNSGYEMFWHTGTTTNSITTTAGEFESGQQAYKCVLAASSSQRIYDRDETLIHGGEVITARVRAKLVSTTGGTITLNAILNATPKDSSPEPFAAGLTQTNAVEASQALTTSWQTFTFTMTAPNGVPRGRVHFTIDQGAGGTSTVVIDRIRITRASSPVLGAWPVGSVFLSVVNTNPKDLLGGGTWVQIAQGRALVGVDPGNAAIDAAEETTGAASHSHGVSGSVSGTAAAVGDHAHGLSGATSSGVPSGTGGGQRLTGGNTNNAGGHGHSVSGSFSGSSDAQSNWQPSIAIYVWKRTA